MIITASSRARPDCFSHFADDHFRFAARIARNPRGIDIGCVDGIEARLEKGVEQLEGGFFIGGPAKDIAAENQRRDRQAGAAKGSLLHEVAPDCLGSSLGRREVCTKDIGGVQRFYMPGGNFIPAWIA